MKEKASWCMGSISVCRACCRVLMSLLLFAALVPACSDDSSNPGPQCNNGIVEGSESCDSTDLNGQTCLSVCGGTGQLACTSSCTFDITGCECGECGNGLLENPEQCDNTDLNGQTCASVCGGTGQLGCTSSCTFDLSGCDCGDCGNGIQEDPEECDGEDLGTSTCQTLGYASGILRCNGFCQLDDQWCTDNECENRFDDDGDGVVDCDDIKCSGRFGCPVEICGDAVDNDQDGMTDCADPDCATNSPPCNAGITITENFFFGLCDNSIDDDDDGLTDQQDPDCQGGPAIMLLHVLDGGMPLPGGQVIYSITVYAENGDLGGDITFSMPAAFSEVVPLDGGSYDTVSGSVTWTGLDVTDGTTLTVHVAATLDPAVPASTEVCGQATVFGWSTDDPDEPGRNETCFFVAP